LSLYLETSCLLKLVLDEPDSPAAEEALDRLHLAAAMRLGLKRPMTDDRVQAIAARALNLAVLKLRA